MLNNISPTRPNALLHACLLGGAIGDSLGADIEFLSLEAINRRFPEGIRDLPTHQGVRGAITDDTQRSRPSTWCNFHDGLRA